MKVLKTQFLGLALAGLILGACSQTGTYETADLMNEQAAAEKEGFKMTPFGMGNENAMVLTGGGEYLTNCITDQSGSIYKASGSLSGTWGNPNNPNEKTINVEVWNTPTTIEYRFTLISADMQNGGNLQYYDEGTATWINQGALTLGVPSAISRPLPSGWNAGDVILEQWRNNGGGGDPLEVGDVSYKLIGICTTTTLSAGTTELCEGAEFSLTATVSTTSGDVTGGFIQILNSLNEVVASAEVTSGNKQVTYSVPTETAGSYTYTAQYVRAEPKFRYQESVSTTSSTVVVIDCGGCEEEFSYALNQDGSYTFTFQSDVEIDGAIVKFTSPHVTAVTSEDGKSYTVNLGNGKGSPTVSTWVGDIEACTPITFTLTFTPDCEQNEAGFANLWTDFKVNEVSKKGISETNAIIKFDCED